MNALLEGKIVTSAEREARNLFREAEASKAITEYERAQKAFHENRERLKALRLARETAAAQAEWHGPGSARAAQVSSSPFSLAVTDAINPPIKDRN